MSKKSKFAGAGNVWLASLISGKTSTMRAKHPSLLVLVAITISTILSASCKKNHSNPPNPYKSDTISAMVNGSAFVVTSAAAIGSHDTAFHQWNITGFKAIDSASITLYIYDTIEVNKPVITKNSAVIYNSASEVGYSSNVGTHNTTITVTSLDTTNHKIEGVFSGNLFSLNGDSVVVTNGKFDVYYDAD